MNKTQTRLLKEIIDMGAVDVHVDNNRSITALRQLAKMGLVIIEVEYRFKTDRARLVRPLLNRDPSRPRGL